MSVHLPVCALRSASALLAGSLGCAALLASGPIAAAAQGGASSTTVPQTVTTRPGQPSATSSTVPPGSNQASTTTSTMPGATTTVVPTTVVDPLAQTEEAGSLDPSGYASQGAFNPATRGVLSAELAAARSRLDDLDELARTTQRTIGKLESEAVGFGERFGRIDTDRRLKVERAAASRESMRQRAVDAYVLGDQSIKLLDVLDNPADYSSGKRFLEVMALQERDAVRTYETGIEELNDSEIDLVDEQARLNRRLVEARRTALSVALEMVDARREVAAYELGSHVSAKNFVFPVVGPVNFIDSWGFPRLAGSALAHWHEGTDIMAPGGRELVAVEDGTMFKVGSNSLGGARVWLRGNSGVEYYYAHLGSFGPGIVDGVAVVAGQVVGYVGDSGDAKGGPTHLHFEVHPGGGGPVNPYPLLSATWGGRSMPSESEALAGPGSLLATLPDEER